MIIVYLIEKGYDPQKIDKHKLKKLSKKSWDAQECLDNKYPLNKREWINWLDISKNI